MSKSHGEPLYLSAGDVARLRRRVVVTATCQVWMGAVGSDGYGRFAVPNGTPVGRTVTPHQVAAQLASGPVQLGSTVLHDCDQRLCVSTRPGHVRVGSQRENMRQAVQRGRAVGPRPGRTDVRGNLGASLAIQAALRDALRTDPHAHPDTLADVLAAAVAVGDPLAALLPLFGEPARTPVPGWDDFPVDLFDPRATPDDRPAAAPAAPALF
ncbi:hypothetical protein [Nakamurella endophytica]|uniref:HNH endonuclease n=1 Tax=Nakamurella endophytica TaxID=1748367 RepID=A0A917T9W3_9ACTN|nr:hypothetical protein [Nakamurella endophytica]GGM15822.1 hypothetical protein GCM10011594_39830 [Nakamurella endophytica]